MNDQSPDRPLPSDPTKQNDKDRPRGVQSDELLSTDAKERAMRPLPEIGQTDSEPDPRAPEPVREHPATGTASHGSASPRKI